MNIGVIFPGMGYHTDKPLLYYGKKMLSNLGYEIIELNYGSLPKDLHEAFLIADNSLQNFFKLTDWSKYNDIVFLSKSIGTIIAGKACEMYSIPARNIFCTPVAETIQYFNSNGIVFHGTNDPLMDNDILRKGCAEKNMPLYEYEAANHSIETPDIIRNTEIIHDIACKYFAYINN